MSIYGITRLLASRDLGPAQIVPSLEAFGSEAGQRCASFEALFEALTGVVAGRPELSEAAVLLRNEAERVFGEIASTFTSCHRLGARDRLALEADAPRIGGELQAVQALTELLLAAVDPQPVPLRLHDLFSGAWRPRPIFVARRVEVMIACSGPGFDADPRVVRAMLEAALRTVTIELPFLAVHGKPPSRLVGEAAQPPTIHIGAGGDYHLETIERGAVELGPTVGIEAAILDAVGNHLGTVLRLDESGARICLAA